MSRQLKLAVGLVSLLALVIVIGCSVSVGQFPGGGGFVSFTILGKSFTFSFGDAGVISVRANQTVQQAAGLRLFEQDPPQAAPSGQMRLLSTDVGVARTLNAKEIVRQQALPYYGTATIRFSVASGTSADLCDSATFLSEYTLNLTAGVASIANEVYELSREALDVIATNDVTLCIEVTSDFDGVITLNNFSLTFGGGRAGGVDASFDLRNTDIENIHILLPGEDFDISNRISPGGSRSVTAAGVDIGDSISLRAGRNGTVLDTATCPTVDESEYTATATWDGSQLTCSAEQGGGVPPGTQLQIPINSAGDAVSPTATYNGVDYGIVGVLNTNTPDAPPANRPGSVSVDLGELGLQYVERIYMAEACAWVPDLGNGVVIATLAAAYEEGGSPTTFDFVMGSNTAEWSYERPEHDTEYGGVPHNLVSVLYSSPTTIDSAFEYDGYMFWTSANLDTSRTLASLTLSIADPAMLSRHPFNPVPTWAGISIVGATLVGPAGTPDGGDGGGGGGTGTVTGQVVHALTGVAVSGATVAISGTGLSTTTDAAGEFSLTDVPEGGQTVVVAADGFVESSTTVALLPNSTANVQVGLVPLGEAGDLVTAVLSWGDAPSDLDLHMSGPDGSGGRFHAYYSAKNPVPYVLLDLDDTSSRGPETMTIRAADDGAFVPGDYHVWVRNFSGSPGFDVSEARIILTAGGAQLAQYDVSAASGDPAQRVWQVVNFAVDADGGVSAVTVVQTFADGSSGDVF